MGNTQETSGMPMRNTNIELLRIILMLIVIAHHYVVNSGITSLYDNQHITSNMVFVQLFGCGGKISINCFLLISGYFMCKSKATWGKWLKLFLEYLFYNVLINIIFMVTGYSPLGYRVLIKGIFPFFDGLGTGRDNFYSLYLILFLLIPFINKLIHSMNKKEYSALLVILLFVYTIVSTFYIVKTDSGYVAVNHWEGIGWYITAYLLGGYIRLYFNRKLSSLKSGALLFASVLFAFSSIVVLDFLPRKINIAVGSYHMVYGCNKLFAVICAVLFFIFFKDLKVKNSRTINRIASTTFGVLLIHANSDTMRNLLWKDVFHCVSYYNKSLGVLVLHAFLTVICVYICCVLIDLIRQRVFESKLLMTIFRNERLNKPMYNESKL